MSSQLDSNTERGARRFLSTLRDVLFESTPEQSSASATPAEASASGASAAEDDLAAARAALRESLGERLGPGIREFTLQVEALREVLPAPAERQRAALRLLSLKGVTAVALVGELERALGALSEQSLVFADKLGARLNALEVQRAGVETTFREDTAAAQQAMARLEAELEAQRARLEELAAAREEQLAACERQRGELLRKKVGFECASRETHTEYSQLKAQLATETV